MQKYIDAIDADELIRRTAELEAVALEQVSKYEPLEDPVLWNRWKAILSERTAFKYDLIDAPIVDAVEVVRCKDCKYNYHNMIPSGEAEHGCTKCIELPITADFYCSWGERREDV